MTWLKLLPQIIKFLLVELPKFIEAMTLANKDRKYNNKVDEYNAALKEYKTSKDLDALNDLSK